MGFKLFVIAALVLTNMKLAKAEVIGLGKLISSSSQEAASTHCKIQKALGMECKKIMLAQLSLDNSEFKIKLVKVEKRNN